MNIKDIKKLLRKELVNYNKDKTNFKPYMIVMKELGDWLKGMKK